MTPPVERVTVWPFSLGGIPIRLTSGDPYADGWAIPDRRVEEAMVEEGSPRRLFRVVRPDGAVAARAIAGTPSENDLLTAQVARNAAMDLLAIADHLDATEGHLEPLIRSLRDTLVFIKDPARRRVSAERAVKAAHNERETA